MSAPESWTLLATILRPQGRKGEVLAELQTDFPERFSDRKTLSLLKDGALLRPATVLAHWLPVGRNAGRIVLHFEGIESINDAETLAGLQVAVGDEERMGLDEHSYYISDLMGCTVVDEDRTIGVVTDVQLPMDSEGRRLEDAAPLLVVQRADGDEVLIPLAKEFLLQPKLAEKRIEMRLPPGLVEING